MITRERLDALTCQNPACDHAGDDHLLYIHAACHPNRPPCAAYDRRIGALVFTCSICDAHVVTIAVAAGEAQ